MELTFEQLKQENQELKARIKQLEAIEKEHNEFTHKKAHDKWVSGGLNGSRGVRK